MPVTVTDIRFKNELRTEDVDFLLYNVGDKATIEIDISITNYAIASTDNEIIINNTDGYIGSYWITDPSSQFVDFKVGDSITLYNYITHTNLGTETVLEKLSDGEIRVSGNFGLANNNVSQQALFSVVEDITSIRYKYNFLENDDQPVFESKIDGSVQEFLSKDLDASDTVTVVPMEALGIKSWQAGSATIKGAGLGFVADLYTSKFTITHTTYITPFMLAAQWDDIQNRIAPDYFNTANALKAVFDFEAKYNYNDPNRIQTLEINEVLGNTGWFDENFNTGLTNYYVDSVVYKRADTTVIPDIELTTAETTVEIVIKNIVDTPFSNNNTKFVLNICQAPIDETEYLDKTKTVLENFLHDRKLQTVGSAAANGDNFGTDYQLLKDVAATFISSSEIKVTAKIAMASNVYDTLSDAEEANYMLWVTVQNHTLSTEVADKVSLLADADEYFIDITDDGLITITNSFLRHPHEDETTEAVSTVDMFPTDEVVAYSQFYIDKTGFTTEVVTLENVELKVKAKNTSTLEEFDLDTFEVDMSGLPVISGNQYIDFSQDRVFHIPAGEIRKTIKVKRRIDLDTANNFYYEAWFPYLHRWEYWEALAGVNGDFFDTAEPQNGFNNFWHRFTTEPNWTIVYELLVSADKDGVNLNYSQESTLTSSDFDTNPAIFNHSIKSYDPANTELYDGATKRYILGYEDTTIKAVFEKATPFNPLVTYMVFGIEEFEAGGIAGRRRISSKWEHDGDTWFLSVDGSKKIKLTFVGNTVTGEALIDKSKIPTSTQQFAVYARVYEIVVETKEFEDSDPFLFEDGDSYLFEDQ